VNRGLTHQGCNEFCKIVNQKLITQSLNHSITQSLNISMQQYLITAYDGTDPDALARRMAARPAHLEAARKLKATGHFIEGGAMLNEEGQMIGSALIMAFETRAALDAYLANDLYMTGGVWQQVEVQPFRCAKF
jgi:uncharacterized protein YciI